MALWLFVLAVCGTAAVMLFALYITVLTTKLETRERLLEGRSIQTLQQACQGGKAKVALVTGANSGIGFALAVKLAGAGVTVVMGCRNKQRGEAAVERVKAAVPGANVSLLQIDVSSLSSVKDAAATLRSTVPRLDFVFCNAGIFPVCGYNWWAAIVAFFTLRWGAFFETGRPTSRFAHFLLQPPAGTSTDGISLLLATHVVGHVALIRQVETLLEESHGRVVWTGSRAASPHALTVPGMPGFSNPHLAGDHYGSAKCVQDLVSAGLDDDLKLRNARSMIVCPGFVDTDIAPPFFRLFTPILFRLRPLLPSFQITPARGASILLHMAAADRSSLDGRVKYVMQHGQVAGAVNGTSTHLLEASNTARDVLAAVEDMIRGNSA